MTLQLIDDAGGDDRNAAYLLVACEIAYLPAEAGAGLFRERLGLEATLISVSNTQAYVGQNETSIVVAFRGSEAPNTLDGFKDWLVTNANNFLILPEGRIGTDFAAAGVGARFHKGFLEALADVWEPLFAAVDTLYREKERHVWVTGHSLGGALTLLAAWRLQQQFIPVHQIFTYGGPMVGNDAAAAAFLREFPDKIHRFVDDLDLVPLLPTVSLVTNNFMHCLTEYRLGDAEASATAAAEPAGSVLKSLAQRTADGLMDAALVDDLWRGLQARIAHHMVSNYQARIDARGKLKA